MAAENHDASTIRDELVGIEVAYARPDVQLLVPCHVPYGTTVREALRLSGLSDAFPEIDAANCPLGIFGQVVGDSRVVAAGDRVEVYRALTVNPREARRARQRSAKQQGSGAD